MIVYEEIFKKSGLSPTQQEIIKIVGEGKTILEIGPSVGYMTRVFLQLGCIVDVVEQDSQAIAEIPKEIRKKFAQSIEDSNIYKLLSEDYDYIIMADVLEHLVTPGEVLKRLLEVSSSKTKLLVSLPNVACWMMRKQLFFNGDFEYQESGLLDKTHLHFYTVGTLPKILSENGWKVEQVKGTITRLPFERLLKKVPLLYSFLVSKYKNLAYYHFLIIASKI
ncbi:class I SAM-dependent methyltransferase [Candidatus Daviesbacteria bacterium]|nr:class I SAM-dependent methyltransferase [Candidatus Daviesbacteria bacterium]